MGQQDILFDFETSTYPQKKAQEFSVLSDTILKVVHDLFRPKQPCHTIPYE